MNPLLDRLSGLDAARVLPISAVLVILLLDAAWVVSAVSGHLVTGELLAAVATGAIALTALLYKG